MNQQNYQDQVRSLFEQCNNYRFYHVELTLKDGSKVDGIIENVDQEGVHILAGEDVMVEGEEENLNRQFYGGYGRRFRRFRRSFFPLAALTAIALFPYFFPPYPYYPPYPFPYF
ncbi:small nuclear ribonucleoprotein [Bacillaceae bacterium Marseille-Q3522]|nr:small nuclear ribonucleoprotein [Bacillaceae bacterium Marseille-Q3522]